MKIAEAIEDLLLVLDVIFTFAAVALKNMKMNSTSDFCFMISGAALMLALIAMIVKRFCKSSKK